VSKRERPGRLSIDFHTFMGAGVVFERKLHTLSLSLSLLMPHIHWSFGIGAMLLFKRTVPPHQKEAHILFGSSSTGIVDFDLVVTELGSNAALAL
jgi:hypothetical protein